MKRYLIACISTDITKENLTESEIEFTNPKIYTCESNQVASELINKYRLDLRINTEIPTIAIALTDSMNSATANIISKTLGKQFDYKTLKPYCTYFDAGVSICIDVLLDNDTHFDPDILLPEWLKASKKRVSIFASKI